MQSEFWLSEAQFARLKPLLPNKPRGVPWVDDRRVISGIVHVLKTGGRWVDAPAAYGPRKTLYNRWVRWAKQGVSRHVFEELARVGGPPAELMLDSNHAEAHRCAAGGEGGSRPGHRPFPRRPHHQGARLGRRVWASSVAFEITPGQLGDARAAIALLAQVSPSLS